VLISSIKNKLKSLSGDKKSVLALVGGTTIAQGLNFIFSPIQTRLFSPEVFGELSVFTSITGIVAVIICLRYELAIVLPKEDDEGFALLKLSWLFAGIISFLSLVIFGFWGAQIYTFFNAPALAHYWYYVPITLLLTGIIQAANYWLTRMRQFTVLSYNKVLPVLAVNLVSIGLGYAGDRALGARLFSVLISNIVNIAVIAWVIIPDLKRNHKNYKTTTLVGNYKNFLLYDIWGALINNLSWMIVPILMNYYYGSFAAGQYSIGLRIIQIPMSIIGASIGQVYIKTASEKRYTKELYSYTVAITKKLFLYTIPFALVLLLFGKPLFTFIFGDKWSVAGIYAQILAPWAVFWFIANPISTNFIILQKQNISLFTSTLNLITRFFSLQIGAKLDNAIIGILIFSISGIFVNCLSIILNMHYANKNDKVQ
jgi:O-antigen/teichoic acid export membrane protein